MSLTSPQGYLSFPHVFKPRAMQPGADEFYSLSLIFDEDAQKTNEYKELRKAIVAAAEEEWGGKAAQMIKDGKLRMPIRDADEKSQYAGYEKGRTFINVKSKERPDVIDGNLNDVVPSDLFPGAKGRITYRCYAYDTNGNRGVGIGLSNLQVTDFTTPRLDGKKKGKDDFDSLDMPEGSAPQNGGGGSADLDDDLPF